jgi:hypothetical protein
MKHYDDDLPIGCLFLAVLLLTIVLLVMNPV